MGPIVVFVNENDEVIGSGPIEQATAEGIIYRLARIVIVNDKQQVLLQKRSPHMFTYPNCWSESAGGMVDVGESYEHAAARETFEELGLSDVHLEPIDKRLIETPHKNGLRRRFGILYRAAYSGQSITIDPQEVAAVQWFTESEVVKLLQDHPEQVSDGFVVLFKDAELRARIFAPTTGK